MIKIKFYGSLKRFGTDFQLDCQTVAEALKALMSQLKGLRHMMQQGMYKVRIGSQYLDNRYLEKGLHYRLRAGMTVHFTPVLKGAKRGGVFGVIAGIALIGAAVLLGPVGGIISSQAAMMLGGMGASMLLGGVAQMVEKEVSVATEITKRTALTRTVTDANVNRLRLTLGVQALFEQNDQGDTHSATVEFKITVGTQQIPFTIKGKYNSSYSRAIIVENLPRVPFTIKVERITADSTSNRLANKTMWASYTEIIDAQFRYPNTAYMGVKFDSEYFNNIPGRTYEIYGIKVRVPSNYDPETRTYTGLWDGTFKVAYTNNPAWILMDIVTHKRYGLLG